MTTRFLQICEIILYFFFNNLFRELHVHFETYIYIILVPLTLLQLLMCFLFSQICDPFLIIIVFHIYIHVYIYACLYILKDKLLITIIIIPLPLWNFINGCPVLGKQAVVNSHMIGSMNVVSLVDHEKMICRNKNPLKSFWHMNDFVALTTCILLIYLLLLLIVVHVCVHVCVLVCRQACVCVCVHLHRGTPVQIKGQLSRVISLLSLKVLGLRSSGQ